VRPRKADGMPLANGAAGRTALGLLGVAPHVAKAVREKLDLWAAHLMRLVKGKARQRGAAVGGATTCKANDAGSWRTGRPIAPASRGLWD
jgi:hypothetical protein